jgi:hypothetical protein
MEEAEAYKRMNDELGYTYKEIALRVGKSEKHIGRYMKMISLPEEIAEKIDSGELSITKAQFLCSLPNVVIDDILKNRTYWFRTTYTFDEMRSCALACYMKDLNDKIIFDTNKEYKDNGTVWPACTNCPHKKQIEMFEEFVKEGKCPYAPCLTAKQNIVEKRKKKSKAEVEAEVDEDDNDQGDPWDETEKEKERRLQHELDLKIKDAVEEKKIEYYFNKKLEIGFKPIEFLYLISDDLYDSSSNPLPFSAKAEQLVIKILNLKTIDEIKTSDDYELILKASMIYQFYGNIDYNEDNIAEWLGCEQCPDDILKAARDKAMGIGPQAKEANAKKKK